MKLIVHNLTKSDFTAYRCIAKNSLGETDGSIKLYGEFIFHINNVCSRVQNTFKINLSFYFNNCDKNFIIIESIMQFLPYPDADYYYWQ